VANVSNLAISNTFYVVDGGLKKVSEIFWRTIKQPIFLLWLLMSSFLCTTQLWLFLWGPINGRGLEVSLGYFLLPLVMVLVGCVLYKEKLSAWQMAAVVLAVLGVGHEIWRIGSIAWETVYVAVAYPIYFFLRRTFKTDHLGGFWWDLCLILPVAFYLGFIHSNTFELMAVFPHLILAVIRYLPFVIFGLLSYLEPVLLAFASIALGERVEAEEWLTYIPIWGAVLLLVIEGTLHLIKQKRKEQALANNVEKLKKRMD